jgi:hypothetical protein
VAALFVQRADYGPEAGKTPEHWAHDVDGAKTSADRFALVQSAIQPTVSVVDKTADCSGDKAVTPAHLIAFTPTPPAISYDDNLNAKNGRADDAGFTKGHAGKEYVVLGPKALKNDDFFWTRIVLSHEFDHVRQTGTGSKLTGHNSEVDAWTTSFVRDFHRAYDIGENGTVCYIKSYRTFSQLAGYYEKTDVSDVVRTESLTRIKDYYNTTIKVNTLHDRVFRFWLYQTLKGSSPRLAQDLNDGLSLNVDPSKPAKSMRQFPCGDAATATFPSPPAVTLP